MVQSLASQAAAGGRAAAAAASATRFYISAAYFAWEQRHQLS